MRVAEVFTPTVTCGDRCWRDDDRRWCGEGGYRHEDDRRYWWGQERHERWDQRGW